MAPTSTRMTIPQLSVNVGQFVRAVCALDHDKESF